MTAARREVPKGAAVNPLRHSPEERTMMERESELVTEEKRDREGLELPLPTCGSQDLDSGSTVDDECWL